MSTKVRPQSVSRSTGRLRAITVGLVAITSVMSFNSVSITTILPVVTRELNATAFYSWPLVAFFAFVVVGTVVAGRYCGQVSPNTVLLGGGIALGAGVLIAGLAPSMAVLVAGRAIQGAGSGVVVVSTLVMVATIYPDEEQARTFSLMTSMGVLPALIGPAVAAVVAEHLSWRLVFLGWVPIVAAILLLLRVAAAPLSTRPESAASGGAGHRGALLYAFVVATGLTLMQFSANIDVISGVLLLALSLALVGPALVRLLPPGTLRLRAGLPAVIAYRGIIFAPYTMLTSFLPLMFTDVYRQPPSAVSLPYAVATVAWVAGAFAVGQWRCVRHLDVIRFGCAQTALSLLSIVVLLSVDGSPIWLITMIYVVNSAVLGAAVPATAVLLFQSCSENQKASSSSAMMLSDAVAKVVTLGLSGLVLTAVLTRGGSAGAALAVCLLLFTVTSGAGALMAGRLRAPKPHTNDERQSSDHNAATVGA